MRKGPSSFLLRPLNAVTSVGPCNILWLGMAVATLPGLPRKLEQLDHFLLLCILLYHSVNPEYLGKIKPSSETVTHRPTFQPHHFVTNSWPMLWESCSYWKVYLIFHQRGQLPFAFYHRTFLVGANKKRGKKSSGNLVVSMQGICSLLYWCWSDSGRGGSKGVLYLI